MRMDSEMRCSFGGSVGSAGTDSCCASGAVGDEAALIAPDEPSELASPTDAGLGSGGAVGFALSCGLASSFDVPAVGGVADPGPDSRVRITTASTRPIAIAPQNQSEPKDCEVSGERAGSGLGSEVGSGRSSSGVEAVIEPSADEEGSGAGSWPDCDGDCASGSWLDGGGDGDDGSGSWPDWD